jgi:hypothetical protein
VATAPPRKPVQSTAPRIAVRGTRYNTRKTTSIAPIGAIRLLA